MRFQRSRGFTLVELLVVIAIIGILVALLLPAIQAAREASRRAQCSNNLKQLGLAIHMYHDTARMFPMGALRPYWGSGACSYPGGLSWIARVLPGLEQQQLYDQIQWTGNGWSGTNQTVVGPTILPMLRCPSDSVAPPSASFGPTNYGGCSGSDGSSYPSAGTVVGVFRESTTCPSTCTNCANPLMCLCDMAKVVDGTANTMAVSEFLIGRPIAYNATTSGDISACDAGTLSPVPTASAVTRGYSWILATWSERWAYSALYPPNDPLHAKYECYWYSSGNHFGARSMHPGGVNVTMTDGAVRFVGDGINLTTWRAISTVNAGETIAAF